MQTLSLPKFLVRIFLEKIRVLDDHDPLWCEPGELRFEFRASVDGEAARTQSVRLPTTGVYHMDAGEQVIDSYLYNGTLSVGEIMEVEICGVEEDWLSPDERLTRYRRSFSGDPDKWTGTYAPGDENNDLEHMADWDVWYRIEVTQLPSLLDQLPKNPVDAKGVPGPLRRMAKHIQERADSSGWIPPDLLEKAAAHKAKMRLPDPREDDPGGPAPDNAIRASISVEANVQIELKPAEDPGTVMSMGDVGRFVSIQADRPFRDAALIMGITPQEANQVDPATLRVFRYDELRKSFQLVGRSGLGNDGRYVWARIHKPGLYGVFGLPRDQARQLALRMLSLARPMKSLYQHMYGSEHWILDPICQAILCPGPDTGILDDPIELDRLGFGDEVGDPYLLEGGMFGPLPRDAKGRPNGSRPFIPGTADGPGSLPPLPGMRRGGTICDDCLGMFDLQSPEMDLMEEAGSSGGRPPYRPWRSVGPLNIAGRVKSLAVHPTDHRIVYAGGAGGGVFKSSDGGHSWFPRMLGELSLSIGAVAVASSNPDIVYAGTGEYLPGIFGQVPSTYSGVGIYRSRDGGLEWELMPAMSNSRISRIVVHPTNPDLIYVAGSQGISRWDESSGTWRFVSGIDTSDIALDPANPQRLYAGQEGGFGVRVTENAEAAFPRWTAMNAGLLLPVLRASFIKLAVSPSNPAILYAQVNFETTPGAVIASAKTYRWNGTRWVDKGLHGFGTQEFWCSFIRVHPTDPERIYVGGVGMEWSPDGGNTWFTVECGHADNHDLVFDPSNPNRTFVANDGGVWQHTQRPGETTWDYTDSNDRLVTTQFYGMSVSQTGRFTIGGSTQDMGILVTHESYFYNGLGGNEGGIFEIDPSNSNIIYWDPWSDNLMRTDTGSAEGARDANNGIQRLLDSSGNPTVIPSIDSLAIHPTNSNLLLCSAKGQGGTFRIYLSADGAAPAPSAGWLQVLADAGSPVIHFAFAPSDPTWVYAVTADGRVLRSTTTGLRWAQVSDRSLPAGPLRGLAVDWDDRETVYVTYQGSGLGFGPVWASSNGGVEWRDISGAGPLSRRLPDLPVWAIVVHRGTPETLYVCNDAGVFRTQDGGDSWHPFDDGLPNAGTTDLKYQPEPQKLYVSTIGRGIYRRYVS